MVLVLPLRLSSLDYLAGNPQSNITCSRSDRWVTLDKRRKDGTNPTNVVRSFKAARGRLTGRAKAPLSLRGALATKQSRRGVRGNKTIPQSHTEIAGALRASQRQEKRRCVTDHLNEYMKWKPLKLYGKMLRKEQLD